MSENQKCVICGSAVSGISLALDTSESVKSDFLICDRCGHYGYHASINYDLTQLDVATRSFLSHQIRLEQQKNIRGTQPFILKQLFLDELKDSDKNISVYDKVNNLLLYLGDNISFLGEKVSLVKEQPAIFAIIGCNIHISGEAHKDNQSKELQNICLMALNEGWIESDVQNPQGYTYCANINLTYKGWEKYHNIKKSENHNLQGFIAMPFPSNDKEKYHPDLKYMVEKCFSKSAENLGFKLFNPLLLGPKAGNLHVRLENEIRKSRFIVADLTNNNGGAYWEAGFAHGLGKPVIYTCHEDFFGGRHFDTGPHFTIKWSKDRATEIIAEMEAVIRNSLFINT